MEVKFEIKLKAKEPINGYKTDETVIIVNPIFDRNIGIAFFPIDKNFDIVYQRQFIGQKDANKKDIFNGDIVKVGGLVEVVEIIDGMLCSYNQKIYGKRNSISVDDEDDVRVCDSNHFEPYEIIGNIYENPELLLRPQGGI